MQDDNNNPFEAPKANLESQSQTTGLGATVLRQNRATRGWDWLVEGFGLFKRNPGIWVGMVVVYIVLQLLMSFIPFAGNLLNPVFFGGFMLAAAGTDRGEEIQFNKMFAGFTGEYFGKLVLVGLILLLLAIAMMLPLVVIGAGFQDQLSAIFIREEITIDVLLILLLVLAISVPIMMAMWFAPALVVFNGNTPIDALKLSFRGCLKNVLPFLVYGLVGILFGIVASIPFFLGWLVLFPVYFLSMYISYKDIFTEQAGAEDTPGYIEV